MRLRLKESSVGREPLFRDDLNTEGKEQPLLEEAVTRQLIVKTLRAGKNYKVWKSVVML
jgi:hypothetical protein